MKRMLLKYMFYLSKLCTGFIWHVFWIRKASSFVYCQLCILSAIYLYHQLAKMIFGREFKDIHVFVW